MFQIGTKAQFLKLLGIPYGYIHVVEGAPPFPVFSLDQARDALAEFTEQKLCTEAEAQALFLKVTEAGLCQNFADIIKKTLEADLGTEFVPSFNFVLCDDYGYPLPHGEIRELNGKPKSATFYNLESAFGGLNNAVAEGNFQGDEAAHVFQQMAKANLSLDEADQKERYEKLPEDVRAADQEKRKQRGVGADQTAEVPEFLRQLVRRSQIVFIDLTN